MDWKDYHRLEVIHDFMDQLEADFPSVCTTATIGKSVEGRHLKVGSKRRRSEVEYSLILIVCLNRPRVTLRGFPIQSLCS